MPKPRLPPEPRRSLAGLPAGVVVLLAGLPAGVVVLLAGLPAKAELSASLAELSSIYQRTLNEGRY